MSRPPPAAAPATRNSRRDQVMSGPLCADGRGSGGLPDGGADAGVGAAAADVARHGVVDVAVGGMRVGGEERRRGHDLARLAVAALHHVEVEPGLLDLLRRRGCRRSPRWW